MMQDELELPRMAPRVTRPTLYVVADPEWLWQVHTCEIRPI